MGSLGMVWMGFFVNVLVDVYDCEEADIYRLEIVIL